MTPASALLPQDPETSQQGPGAGPRIAGGHACARLSPAQTGLGAMGARRTVGRGGQDAARPRARPSLDLCGASARNRRRRHYVPPAAATRARVPPLQVLAICPPIMCSTWTQMPYARACVHARAHDATPSSMQRRPGHSHLCADTRKARPSGCASSGR